MRKNPMKISLKYKEEKRATREVLIRTKEYVERIEVSMKKEVDNSKMSLAVKKLYKAVIDDTVEDLTRILRNKIERGY